MSHSPPSPSSPKSELLLYSDETGETSLWDGPEFVELCSLPTFEEAFLDTASVKGDVLAQAKSQYSAFIATIEQSSNAVEDTLRLLNALVDVYRQHCATPLAYTFEFVDHSEAALAHHPCPSSAARPCIIAVPSIVANSWKASHDAMRPSNKPSAIAWHHVIAAVHFDNEHLLRPCADFFGALNQARPDLPGCFSLMVTRSSCRFAWSDPSSLYTSEPSPWLESATLLSLLAFVKQLHSPLLDPTIRLEQPADATPSLVTADNASYVDDFHSCRPVWLVEDDLGGVYRVISVIAVGDPWTRQNWVAFATEYRAPGATDFDACPRTIVKDSWPSLHSVPVCEGAILQHIHAEGVVPGVCRILRGFNVQGVSGHLRTVAVRGCGVVIREKHRLILDGTGRDLYTCPSILHFLMVVFDALEVLKNVHEQRGVLHRDISIHNITHSPSTEASPPHGQTKFIGDILSHHYAQFRAGQGPTCTLIDFDNAFWDGHTCDSSLKKAVGTPTFMSRAISQNFALRNGLPPPCIAPLTGSARECYIHAHGVPHYEMVSLMHNSQQVRRVIPADRAIFSPRHDAESCFWTLLRFFLTALPANADPVDNNLEVAKAVFRQLELHRIGPARDTRESLCSTPSNRWRLCLHRDLESFGDLLQMLGEMVQPIYEYCDPPLPPYHLHEAIQRILLQEICRILDAGADVRLDVHHRRALGPETDED